MATWAKGIDFKNTNNTARIGGVGAYGTDSTVQKLYFGLGTEPWNNAGLQLTSSSINFKGNKIYHAGDKPTASEIGAAPSSHTHSSLKSTDPVRPTSANLGVVADRSLSMMLSTSSMTTGKPLGDGYILNFNWDNNGGWASQLYVQNSSSPKMQIRGMNAGTWGEWNTLYGTNNKPTPAEIGAAASSHTHNYIPLTGGTFTGNVSIESSAPSFTIKNTGGADTSIIFDRGSNANWRIRNTSGNLLFESDYASSKGSYYAGLTLNYNSGNLTAKGEIYANGGNRVYHTGNKPTPADIGAAASSHTHNYAGSSSAGGAATTALACTGNSATATTSNYLSSNTRMDYGWNGVNYFNISGTAGAAAKANDTPTSAWWHVMRFNHANNSGYYTDLAIPFNDTSLYYKRITNGSVQNGGWVKVLDSLNYNSYSPTKTGGGASGTWGISVSGNANTATTLQTARTINGTSFNGSANITTANWGTARTITIGNTGKSVNGSGNVSWSLSEIGAAASSHTHNYLPLSGGTLTGETVFNNYLSLNAWSGYGTGKAQIWYNGNNKQLIVQPNAVTDIIVNNNKVYHAGNKPTASDIGAAASNHTHGLVNLNSEAFGGGNDLNTYNSTKTWVARTINTTTNRPHDYYTVVNFGANSNSNFQLAHNYGNNSILYVRGRHDTSGNYTPWAKVYTDKNKPTAADIGAAASNHTHSNYATGALTNSYNNGTSEPCEGYIHLGGSKYLMYGYCSISLTANVGGERTYSVPGCKRIYGITLSCYTKGGTGNFGELALKQTYSDGFTFRLWNVNSGGAHYITYMIIGDR